MTTLMKLLTDAVVEQSRSDNVAVLLSGGIDSLSVALALQSLGKNVHAYTYELEGYPSQERKNAEAIARHFGWPLTIVTVPVADIRADFLRLAAEHRCRKKVQFEVMFPLLYIYPCIREAEIWTGWNADDHYGNSKKVILEMHGLARGGVSERERKLRFDDIRRDIRLEFEAADSSDTWWYARRFAEKDGKVLLDPYLSPEIYSYFMAFDHDQLSSPKKPLVRAALESFLNGLPERSIAVDVQMQKGGHVDTLFEFLLSDPTINCFETRYSKVSPLCLRWAREVQTDPKGHEAAVAALPPARNANVRLSRADQYDSYRLHDVHDAASKKLFTAVSMFSGGGGSSIGYRSAGGSVLAASEFVPQAAQTYNANFPETPVDRRDIREILASPTGVEDFLSTVGLKPGDLDILDGSPPCSEFSVAGRGVRHGSELRSYSDVEQTSIATLPFDYVEFAARARPKVVIFENVPGLTHRKNVEIFNRVMQRLRFSAGPDHERAFYAGWSLLLANDFGVPQDRKRLFVVAVRADVAERIGITNDDDIQRLFPSPVGLGPNIRAAFRGLSQTYDDIEPWLRSALSSSLGPSIRRLPKCPSKRIRLSDVDPSEEGQFTLTRTSWDLPAPTLVVMGQRPDGVTGAIHPEEDRKFTLPEMKRLFGLPDDYLLTGTLSQAAERICRMVPPFLTKAIAESLYEKVLRPYAEASK